jgi:hypothetical protein
MNTTGNYDVIVCTGDESKGNNGFIKYRKVTNLDRLSKFLNDKYPSWKFANVYNKKTKEKEGMLKP